MAFELPHGSNDNSRRVSIISPIENNGALPVNIQDQNTPTIDSYFLQSISNFTLASPTVASGITQGSLVYDFTATTGHGLANGDEILLLDTASNTDFYATVILVSTDTITLDRPIEFLFPTATTLGRIVTSEMAVNGAITEQIFTVRAGVVPFDITRIIMQMTHATAGDDGKFGGITAITRGIVFRIVDLSEPHQESIFNFKTNGEIRAFCYDVAYSDKAPGGENGTGARLSFAGQDKHGVTLRISGSDVLQWVIQDDLTGLSSFKVVAQGHEVTE